MKHDQLSQSSIWETVYHSTKLYMPFVRGELRPLHACESGSRAWRFFSYDSDYDVRFIYCRPRSWYLRLDPFPDTINFTMEQENIDVVGWDITKLLSLVRKGNASAYEWMLTCPVYHTEPQWLSSIRPLLYKALDPVRLARHHHGLASNHWRRYLEDAELVTHKKYLYIFRALWSAEWYMHHDSMAPIVFTDLLDASDAPLAVRVDVWDMVIRKQQGNELGLAGSLPLLNNYIEQEVKRIGNNLNNLGKRKLLGWTPFNQMLLRTLAYCEEKQHE